MYKNEHNDYAGDEKKMITKTLILFSYHIFFQELLNLVCFRNDQGIKYSHTVQIYVFQTYSISEMYLLIIFKSKR